MQQQQQQPQKKKQKTNDDSDIDSDDNDENDQLKNIDIDYAKLKSCCAAMKVTDLYPLVGKYKIYFYYAFDGCSGDEISRKVKGTMELSLKQQDDNNQKSFLNGSYEIEPNFMDEEKSGCDEGWAEIDYCSFEENVEQKELVNVEPDYIDFIADGCNGGRFKVVKEQTKIGVDDDVCLEKDDLVLEVQDTSGPEREKIAFLRKEN